MNYLVENLLALPTANGTLYIDATLIAVIYPLSNQGGCEITLALSDGTAVGTIYTEAEADEVHKLLCIRAEAQAIQWKIQDEGAL